MCEKVIILPASACNNLDPVVNDLDTISDELTPFLPVSPHETLCSNIDMKKNTALIKATNPRRWIVEYIFMSITSVRKNDFS